MQRLTTVEHLHSSSQEQINLLEGTCVGNSTSVAEVVTNIAFLKESISSIEGSYIKKTELNSLKEVIDSNVTQLDKVDDFHDDLISTTKIITGASSTLQLTSKGAEFNMKMILISV